MPDPAPTSDSSLTPSLAPSPLPPTATLTPTATLPPPDWEALTPGIAWTTLWVEAPEEAVQVPITAVRIDPALTSFQVFYDAEEPHTIEEWHGLINADLVVNGGFFSGDNRPVGRLIIDGYLYGAPFGTEGRIGTPGLFAVLDDAASIYALGYADYNPRGLRFDEAIEAYPMLLLPGRTVAYPNPPPERPGQRARRTIIGIDEEGQVIILVVDYSIFTLRELANWLATSNLPLDMALNLDGGRSSGMVLSTGGVYDVTPSYVSLPIVLAVFRRPASN